MTANSVSADKTIWKAPDHVAVAVVISQEQYERYEELERRLADKDANIAELIETLQRTEAAASAGEWEVFIASDGQPAIRRRNQHVRGLNAEGEKK